MKDESRQKMMSEDKEKEPGERERERERNITPEKDDGEREYL